MNRNDRRIVGFTMVGHALVHTYELSIPILLSIWLLEFSTTAAVLGGAVTVGYALFGIGALPGGLLADRYGCRTLVCACFAGMGCAFLLVAVAPGIAALTVALAAWGLAASVYHPAGLALLSNGVEERGLGFAYHGMAGNVGIALGPLATALALLAVDWRVAAALLALPGLVAAVLGLRLEFDERAAVDPAGMADGGDGDGERRRVDSLADFLAESGAVFAGGFALAFVVVALSGFYYRGMLTFLPELLGEFLEASVGEVDLGLFDPESPAAEEFDLAQYLYVALLIVGVAGQYAGGRLSEAIAPDRGLVLGFVAFVVVSLGFVPAARAGLLPLVAASVVLGFVLFAIQPLEQATIATYSTADARGLSFGYTYLAIFGIGALGATAVGVVLTRAGEAGAFLSLAAVAAVACLLAIALVRR